jgi:hypothetical protein
MSSRLFKVIACEIAFREICHCAASCSNLLDLEFVTQGLHDFPRSGVGKIQERIDAVPEGRYEAILLGYALCGHLIAGLQARHTPLVIPRAHDCIALFLGSRERQAQLAQDRPGTYFYTSGWLECLRKRGEKTQPGETLYLATPAGMSHSASDQFEKWVARYGEEKARYLMSQLDTWSEHYQTGALIEYDFTRPLRLQEKVQSICDRRGWRFEEIPGDLGLLRRWLDGDWNEADFLIVPPGKRVVPSYDEEVVKAEEVLA